MYALERSVLDLIPPGENVSIERDVFPRLVGGGLHGLLLDGYWVDIGTPERYRQASWDILERRVRDPGRAHRAGVLVGAGAEVGGRRRSARGSCRPGCRVGAGAEIRDSVVLDGCTVGEGARARLDPLRRGRGGRRGST